MLNALALALALALAHGSPQPSDSIVLQNAQLRLAFSARDGRLLELVDRASGQSFVAPGGDGTGIWALERYDGGPALTPAAARRFTWSRLPGPVPTVRLVWSGFERGAGAAPRLRVSATIALAPDATDSEWRIVLDDAAPLQVERVVFPRIAPIPPLAPPGGHEALAVPRWMGAIAHDPRRFLAGKDGATGRGRTQSWPYPGTMSLQALALYRDGPAGGPGLYAAAEDTLAYRKDFVVRGEPSSPAAKASPDVDAAGASSPAAATSLGFELATPLENPATPKAHWTLPYAAVIGTFDGDWLTAAQRYRAWGTRQRWARDARLTNGRVAPWLTGTALWVWNRGRSPGVIPPAIALQKALGLPVSVYWHWWHHGPYDTSFPDYLPPREGVDSFTAAVRTAHAAGLHTMVYMNQRLWCVGTPSWPATGAARWAVKEKDGKVREETYNVFDPQACATMDVTTPFWQNKYAGMADTVVNRYGVDGVYMDQAVQSLICWDPAHGHPLGGGNYWMAGFSELERRIRRRTFPLSGQATVLAGEGAGETWLPELDLMLTLQVSQERYTAPGSGWDPIPFWQAVYHPFGLTYGNYSSLSMPPYDDLWPKRTAPDRPLALLDTTFRSQFFLEQARAFVWGLQPTIANFLATDLAERPVETAYLLRIARLRAALPQFFVHGTFLRPPALRVPDEDIDLSRISIYAAQRGGPQQSRGRYPAAIAGAWRAPDGSVAVVVASIVDRPLAVPLTLDPRVYGLAGARLLRIDEHGAVEVARISTPQSVTLELPAGGAAVLELTP